MCSSRNLHRNEVISAIYVTHLWFYWLVYSNQNIHLLLFCTYCSISPQSHKNVILRGGVGSKTTTRDHLQPHKFPRGLQLNWRHDWLTVYGHEFTEEQNWYACLCYLFMDFSPLWHWGYVYDVTWTTEAWAALQWWLKVLNLLLNL